MKSLAVHGNNINSALTCRAVWCTRCHVRATDCLSGFVVWGTQIEKSLVLAARRTETLPASAGEVHGSEYTFHREVAGPGNKAPPKGSQYGPVRGHWTRN